MKNTRREFIKKTLIVSLSTTVVGTLLACKETTISDGGLSITIGSNHGHTFDLAVTDVEAETVKVYSLSDVGHTHSFTPSLAQMQALKAGTTQNWTSTLSGHTHSLTISYS